MTETYTTLTGRELTFDPTPEEAAFLARARQATADPTVSLNALMNLLYGAENPVLEHGLFPGRGHVTMAVLEKPIYHALTDLIDQKRIQEGADYSRVHERYTMTVSEAADRLGITTGAVRQAIDKHKLAAMKRNNRWLISPASVDAYTVGRQGPGNKLEVCWGHRPNQSMNARHDGQLVEQGSPGGDITGVMGVLSGWSRLAVLTTRPLDFQRKTQWFFWLEPGDEECVIEEGPFYIKGRFRIVEEVKKSVKARELWKESKGRVAS